MSADLYTRCISLAWGIPVEQVTPYQRNRAKTWAFVAVYRQAPNRTEEQLTNEVVNILSRIAPEHRTP